MEAILERARRIELLILDVDGVLTDGRILILSDGREGKFFHFHDGHGIRMVRQAGVTVALLSARESEATTLRAKELGVTICVQGARDKLTAGKQIAADCGVALDRVAFMGDDVLDVPLMPHVGLAVAPADARPEAKDAAGWVTQASAGRGAVRELTDLLIRARSASDGSSS